MKWSVTGRTQCGGLAARRGVTTTPAFRTMCSVQKQMERDGGSATLSRNVRTPCFRGAGVGGFRRVGFSPLQFCLTEKTLSCANEAPIWGRQLRPPSNPRGMWTMRGGDPPPSRRRSGDPQATVAFSSRAVEPATQQERCEQVVIRRRSVTYVEEVRPISREDLIGRDCDGRG